MAVIDANIPLLKNTGDRLAEQAADYNHAISWVSAVRTELGKYWKGDAQAAFLAEQAEALAFYKEMRDRVKACADSYRYAASRYTQADSEARKIIRAANS